MPNTALSSAGQCAEPSDQDWSGLAGRGRTPLADLGALVACEAVVGPAIAVVGDAVLRSGAGDRFARWATIAEEVGA